MRRNMYIHYDSVTNHIMTRSIDLRVEDFPEGFFPKNLILGDSPDNYGRFDPQTNFTIIRGPAYVREYMLSVRQAGLRLSNWIDFEDIETMHMLSPQEIADLLYLFHAHRGLRSAFYYKLQNNYVFLTLPNGLIKMFYRYVDHFSSRFQRAVQQMMYQMINENRLFFSQKTRVTPLSNHLVNQITPYFTNGLKINFSQSYIVEQKHYVPLDIIEDELTLLSLDQQPKEHIGFMIYDTSTGEWGLEFKTQETK